MICNTTKQYNKGATTHLANKQTPTYRRKMWAESDYDEGGPGGMVGNFRRTLLNMNPMTRCMRNAYAFSMFAHATCALRRPIVWQRGLLEAAGALPITTGKVCTEPQCALFCGISAS